MQKLKEGIVIASQIVAFQVLQTDGKAAWNALKSVCSGCLGNKDVSNYKELVNEMLMFYP